MPSFKRITSIELDNYRAYYGNYDPLLLDGGQNLLIYGENGSGKSSLFKAINNYLTSSRNPGVPFVKNRFSPLLDGSIKITFDDFDEISLEKLVGPSQQYTFCSTISNTNVNFLQDAALIKGFLDYTSLLDVYLHKEEKPNLFYLIVLNLLGDTIPVSSGGNFRFRDKWVQLQRDLIAKSYTRKDWAHRIALDELPTFQAHLLNTLTLIFSDLNRLLANYFSDLGIELRFTLQPIVFNYKRKKWDWFTTADLRLEVIKDGVLVTGDYKDLLNEARLSAFSICLYLAALRQNPAGVELKVLYLDDVFVGLDAGNRLPILRILQMEFSDYQIFISTYDRHWFELAKSYFNIHIPKKWLSTEFYVGSAIINGATINKPIVVVGESNYEKAVQYLHNRTKPDYPAAANYFRKALEQLIQEYIPKWETADAESTQLPDYQLTSLLLRTKGFLDKTGNNILDVNSLLSLLHNLLHPLSHHEISSPIYRGELELIDLSYIGLKQELLRLDIKNNFKCGLEPNKRLKMTLVVNSQLNHYCYYELILKEPLTLIKNDAGIPVVAKTKCYADKSYGNNGAIPYQAVGFNKKQPHFNYNSLEAAYDTIYAHLITTNVGAFPKETNYLSTLEYNDGTTWQPLLNLIVW